MRSSGPPPGPRSTPAEASPLRFGKYLLERRLAVGGSSEVYLARPAHGLAPAPRLVIKRLLPVVLEEPESISTFALEARLHRAARHPNVVEVFEAGSVEGEPYLAMEYVDGLDTYRLMRRAQAARQPIPPQVALFIASELCGALACVHNAFDDNGHPLAVVHRDVTPTNIYLSLQGDVKLGDFGIARLRSRTSAVPNTSPLKGKYSYLSPEQVAGENFDHRADLFSLAVVLTELLINQPLFPGGGQLAVLLTIRDCRIDRLHENASMLPPGLMPVLERALSRQPSQRFASAEQLSEALAPFLSADTDELRRQLAQCVAWAQTQTSVTPPLASTSMRAQLASDIPPSGFTSPAAVRTRDGQLLGPLPFFKLVELTATQRLQPDDEVDLAGAGFRPLAQVPELARYIPQLPTTTSPIEALGVPDFVADLSHISMLEVCAKLLSNRETGVLFAERDESDAVSTRKEIYLSQAKIIHVASSEPGELLGEYLVRRGLLERAELDLALAVLPRYDGRLGDTLIGLNLVDAVQIFRAIRDQGRDRVTEIFRWPQGRLVFYRYIAPHRVEFPLDLDLAPLMLSGLQGALTDADMVQAHLSRRDDLLMGGEVPETLRLAAWPPEVLKVVGAAGEGRAEREIVAALTAARLINAANALRAIDVACAAGLLRRQPRR